MNEVWHPMDNACRTTQFIELLIKKQDTVFSKCGLNHSNLYFVVPMAGFQNLLYERDMFFKTRIIITALTVFILT